MKRFLWIDDTDLFLAKEKFASLRHGQFSDRKWVRWVEDDFQDNDQAFIALDTEIGIPSMFSPAGKVIYSYGIPKCQALIAERLPKIREDVLLIIVAKPNRVTTLYKRAKEMEKSQLARVEECPDPNGMSYEDKARWIEERALKLGMRIDEQSSYMLTEIFGFAQNKIHMELEKLKGFSADGVIAPWVIEQVCFGNGDTDAKFMTRAVMDGDGGKAHEYLQRLLDRDGQPFATFGFLMGWVRRLCCAMQCGRGMSDADTEVAASVLKWEKKSEKKGDEEEGKEGAADVSSDADGKGKSIPMFSNPKGLYYSCRELAEAGKPEFWPIFVLAELWALMVDVRGMYGAYKPTRGSDYAVRMHQFIDRIMGEA